MIDAALRRLVTTGPVAARALATIRNVIESKPAALSGDVAAQVASLLREMRVDLDRAIALLETPPEPWEAGSRWARLDVDG